MSSDGTISQDRRSSEEASSSEPEEPSPGAQVLGLPTGEVSSPGRPVPAGTWAAPAEMDAAESTERPVRRTKRAEGEVGQVVEFPRQPVTQRRRRASVRPDEPTGPQKTPAPIEAPGQDEPERPKFLASELLKTNWYPRNPLARTLRLGSIGIGAPGAIAMLVLGGLSQAALLLAGLLAACAAIGAVPMPPTVRGVALAMLGSAGLTVAAWAQWAQGNDPAAPLLVACVTLCAAALFFRAAHRTSRFARALVGVGLAATALWLILTGGVEALLVESLAWQAWVWPVMRVLLGIAVLSSLLSFLDPMGHGGAWIAGGAFLVWLALHAASSSLLGAWPLRGEGAFSAAWLSIMAVPLLAPLAAGGMCQVLALTSRPPRVRREMSRATIA